MKKKIPTGHAHGLHPLLQVFARLHVAETSLVMHGLSILSTISLQNAQTLITTRMSNSPGDPNVFHTLSETLSPSYSIKTSSLRKKMNQRIPYRANQTDTAPTPYSTYTRLPLQHNLQAYQCATL